LRNRTHAIAVVVALAAALAAVAGTASASSDAVRHKHSRYWISCKPYFRRTITGPWGSYIVRDDVFKLPGVPRAKVCLRHEKGQPSFTIVASDVPRGRLVVAYPEIFYGCEFRACSPGSILPEQVRKLPSRLRFSAYTVYPAHRGKFNDSLDIWFSIHHSIGGQPAGAEIMVWLYRRHVRIAPGYRVRIHHTEWLVEEWRTHSLVNGRSWPLIIFIREKPSDYCHRLYLSKFIKFAEAHRWMRPTYWLESIAQGYEIWAGGKHVSTRWFRVLP
jgi:hypothetical protein